MGRPVFSKDRWIQPYRFFGLWYAAWFLVGLGVMGFNLPPLFGPIEDFLFIFLAATVVWLEVVRRIGWAPALLALGWVVLLSSVVETIGTLTGFPFGQYAYSSNFGPRLGGVLPLAIPLAWWVLIFPLQVVVLRLRESNWLPAWSMPFWVGACAVVIDLVLEPVATLERGYWIWQGPGFWYGVPWTNFVGWFVTAVILSAGLRFLIGGHLRRAYGCAAVDAHSVPLLVLLSVLVTFLVANLVAGAWLAGGLALVVCLLIWGGLRCLGHFQWSAVSGIIQSPNRRVR